LFVMAFRRETEIPDNYRIGETAMLYYALYNFYIVLFALVLDVLLLNTQELVHGWKIFDYVSYQRYRFSVRDHRWAPDSGVVDESLAQSMQTLDAFCFSSQYYFVLALYAMSTMLSIYGVTIFFRKDYNLFGDPVALVILLIVFLLGDLLQAGARRLADLRLRRLGWRGLWRTKHVEGTVDDDVAAKLAIGEGRQAGLEQERLELQALNSERFRHRFLDRNRPWILQHLVELLTPETLNEIGPDGRPVVEYVRDVYAQLAGLREGARRPQDRSDISSDEDEDDAGRAGRGWPPVPVQGVARDLALLWLGKARKRRAFWKLVAGFVDAARQAECAACGCADAPPDRALRVQLMNAHDGDLPDPGALDVAIAGFEAEYGPQEKDVGLWRAFFRAHVRLATLCDPCFRARLALRGGVDDRDARTKASAVRGGQATRLMDVSSDEENTSGDDEVRFDPMVVGRDSDVGRMMGKWLGAARRRLGGEFPRPHARREMEKYANKMRERQLRRARTGAAGDGEGHGDDERAGSNGVPAAWIVRINAASRAIALRWVAKAQNSVHARLRKK
ncbi:MAG: hypothetical protein AAFS07_19185, partial [Pseudomonadota bacterium]